ncbi:4a-hydroxytetrahydrobiopterin dehydratase [Pseudomonas sp. ABC1]|uniref:4a-hydroxytetrahydrobiopterin dehydratase n=1 Tax=Pseudomonas sp. ABC1 TaxID=2748080 RepID=UPI0015C3ADAB|nr:4a-hydroxytetrahydrobiopterin dehydratase [Pseudomonas sp. ABC1]QLF92962.1 4a-hydroxytetrahydrobiopterin dehydratase [Pseudomonas sp. ABC1]
MSDRKSPQDSPIQTSPQAESRVADEALAGLIEEIPGWNISVQNGIKQLEKTYSFKDFAQALEFVNAIGEMAEAANHHPALLLEWGKVTVRWWSHESRGLHLKDFQLAAHTDELSR